MIIAFDTAINVGVAFGRPGSKPTAYSVNLGKVDWNVRFSRALRLVEKLVTEHKPTLIAVEAPAQGDFSNSDLVGLTICVRAQATRMGVPVQVIFANSVRKHFLGKALQARDFPGLPRAQAKIEIKKKVMERCRLLGWSIPDFDAADAAAMWDLACTLQSPSHQLSSLPGMFARG